MKTKELLQWPHIQPEKTENLFPFLSGSLPAPSLFHWGCAMGAEIERCSALDCVPIQQGLEGGGGWGNRIVTDFKCDFALFEGAIKLTWRVRLMIEGFTVLTLVIYGKKAQTCTCFHAFPSFTRCCKWVSLLPEMFVNKRVMKSDGKVVISTLCPGCDGPAQPRLEEPGQSWEELWESSHR